ncbi:MAG: DUF3267 domain-containing protein [Clostridia bacterium]|nr:DUF3267 domain-containing protein [Clostridia bacterium]
MNYKTLPEGYRFAGLMDFTRNRKQILAVFKLAVILLIVFFVIGLIAVPPKLSWRGFLETWYLWVSAALMWLIYIPLHELTHGVAMYALSGVKPTYGIRLPYAYAGSTVWFDRKSHIVTALAPVIIWGVVLQILIHVLPRLWFWPLWLTQLSNLSGSAGDIYCVHYLARMDGDILIRDDGTRMRVMRKIEQ